jgi:hypothetical protein
MFLFKAFVSNSRNILKKRLNAKKRGDCARYELCVEEDVLDVFMTKDSHDVKRLLARRLK